MIRPHRLAATALLAAAVATPALGHEHEHEHRSHGAHEHGAAQLNIVLDGQALLVELISPAYNVVGFEHAPRDAAQHEAVRRAAEILADPRRVLVLPAEAACSPAHTRVVSELLSAAKHDQAHSHQHDKHSHHEHGHDHHGDHQHGDHEHGDAHAEFHATYEMICRTPKALRQLEVRLFELFPASERLDVQIITAQGQSRQVLRQGAPVLRF
jgi:ABC-type Zn2+ transport system substrate-binding protein/surface adhesin